MDGIPILDYTPATLLGVLILMLLAGKGIVPASSLKMYIEQNAYLRSALEKSQEALAEEQKTTEIVRRVFGDLETRSGS